MKIFELTFATFNAIKHVRRTEVFKTMSHLQEEMQEKYLDSKSYPLNWKIHHYIFTFVYSEFIIITDP